MTPKRRRNEITLSLSSRKSDLSKTQSAKLLHLVSEMAYMFAILQLRSNIKVMVKICPSWSSTFSVQLEQNGAVYFGPVTKVHACQKMKRYMRSKLRIGKAARVS